MQTKWELNKSNREVVGDLMDEFYLPKSIALCYYARGLTTTKKIKDFFNVNMNKLHDPFLLPDMKIAVNRINKAIINQELIHIHGDYDVDGITSTAILTYAFRKMGANFTFYTPHRIEDGYDFKEKHVLQASKNNVKLIILVDCGIRAFVAAQKAKELGIDLIITDHHLPKDDDSIPDCFAVINAHRKESVYPFKYLAGCGIAMKVVLALAQIRKVSTDKILDQLLDYVTLGTVSDVAPIIDENRIIVANGCNKLLNSNKVGIRELLKVANIKSNIDTTSIGYYIGPRINAIGRLADSFTALELLLENNSTKASMLAQQLNTANERRQRLQEQSFVEALALLPEDMSDTYIIILSAKNWHPGLVGLVSSKLTDMYGMPSMVGVETDYNTIKGSCRSTQDFSIIDALKSCHDLFISYGGHEFAAGFEISKDNFIELKQRINEYAKKQHGEDFKPCKIIKLDAKLYVDDINNTLYDHIKKLAPFGNKNEEPIFATYNVVISDVKTFGAKNLYLKFRIKENENSRYWIPAVWWRRIDNGIILNDGDIIDIAYKIKANDYMGRNIINLVIEDVKKNNI